MEHFNPYLDIPQVKQLADQVLMFLKNHIISRLKIWFFAVGSNRKEAWRPDIQRF